MILDIKKVGNRYGQVMFIPATTNYEKCVRLLKKFAVPAYYSILYHKTVTMLPGPERQEKISFESLTFWGEKYIINNHDVYCTTLYLYLENNLYHYILIYKTSTMLENNNNI